MAASGWLAGGIAWAAAGLWGRVVVDIRLDPAFKMKMADFSSRVTQKKGEPLDPAKVSESLKNLYATGRFEDLRADAEEQGAGVILVFRGQAQFFVGLLRVQGAPRHIDPSAIISISRLRLGEPVSEELRARATSRVATLLADNAYYRAQVGLGIDRDAETQEEDITFVIDPGRPAHLSRVDFVGNIALSPARLAAEAKWKPHTQLTSARLQRGIARLHRFYFKQGRLEATISIDKRQYDPKTATEQLIVRIEAGPLVRVQVRGAHISSSALKRILPVYRQGAVDDIALREGAGKIENYLQTKGYFHAHARFERKTEAPSGRLDITYDVDRGPRGDFDGYEFRGNDSLSDDVLASVVQIQPVDFPVQFKGLFDQELLDHDVKALTALYQSRGFLDAHVSADVNDRYKNEPNHLFVTYNIHEGPLTRVRNLGIEGVSADARNGFESSLLTRPGQPYSSARARSDRDSILTYFANHGYNQATLTWSVSPLTPSHEVDVEYRVTPGPKAEIQQVLVMGNEHTRDGVIDRRLTFDARQPLAQSKLLESQQRLYDLGLFNQVQIATQNPNSPETEKTVLVSVEEAKRWTVGYGGGVDVQRLSNTQSTGKYRASPRIALELDRINVGGRPQTFTLSGHFSNLEKIGSTSYVIPDFLTHPNLTFQVEGLLDQSRNVLTFNAKRQEAGVSLQKQYSAHASLIGRYSFRRVEVSDLRIEQQAVPLFSQPVRVAMVDSGYVNDHRDNPVDASKGSYSFVDAGIAWSGLGSEADFLRLSGQNSTYYRLRPYLIFARNTRIGFEGTYGCPLPTLANGKPCTVATVPLPERFFMGGSESHRGFSLNQAGPRDPQTGFPVGGKALFLNQLELRFPVEENRFGIVLFNDAGNVFSSVNRMRLFKFTQNSPTDFDYDVEAAGIGLRYQTPVGPVRLDVGYALNPPRFQQCARPLPACDLEVLRLPRIQFLLSVGQSF